MKLINTIIENLTSHNGVENELYCVYEELSEFEQAICKIIRYDWRETKYIDNFIEEMTDCIITLEWLCTEIVQDKKREDFEVYKEFSYMEKDALYKYLYNTKRNTVLNDILLNILTLKQQVYTIIDRGIRSNKQFMELHNSDIWECKDLCWGLLDLFNSLIIAHDDDSWYNDITIGKVNAWSNRKIDRTKKRLFK